MAKFVVTHGGRAILNDIILRGYIYALGGRFKGEVEATSGVFRDVKSPNGNFVIDKDGKVAITGRFETEKEGNRIIIDPSENSLSMKIRVGDKELDVVTLKYETEQGSFDFGKLSLVKMQISRDEYGNEIPVPIERVDISPLSVDISRIGAPSMRLSNEGMMVSKDNKYLRVGFQDVYVGEGGGIPTKSWISTLESNAWPTVKNASSGGVYVDWQTDPDTYETTVGILKVKP
jgi:hypothetical protein